MNELNLPQILTPVEMADYLKVSQDLVSKELENGKLPGFKVGAEWRSTDAALLQYVNKIAMQPSFPKSSAVEQPNPEDISDFAEIGPFDFHWPKMIEHFEGGYETTKIIHGHSYIFKIGFTDREAAGRLRRRVVIWRDNWPLVEFASGNNYASDGLLASIIKLKNGKQLRQSEKIPEEYKNFHIERYDSLIQGPYASRNMAIIIYKDDLESMLHHAIIRGKWKNLL